MSENREPTVTLDELVAVLTEGPANDLWALILKNRQPKLSLTKAQTESAIAILEGRSKAKGDYEALGKAAVQWYKANPAGALLYNFIGGDDMGLGDEIAPQIADHPAVRYGRQAAPRQEEAPAEEITSKRSPRRGPRPV